MDERATLLNSMLRLDHRLMEYLQAHQNETWLAVDLTMQQLKVLFIVFSREGGTATAGQIAHGLGVSLSTVTGIVDRLCDHGLVTRGEDPRDRRVTQITITPAGRELIEQLHHASLSRLAPLLQRLDTDTLRLFKRALDALSQAAAEAIEEECANAAANRFTPTVATRTS